MPITLHSSSFKLSASVNGIPLNLLKSGSYFVGVPKHFIEEFERIAKLLVEHPELGTPTTRGRRGLPAEDLPLLGRISKSRKQHSNPDRAPSTPEALAMLAVGGSKRSVRCAHEISCIHPFHPYSCAQRTLRLETTDIDSKAFLHYHIDRYRTGASDA